MSNRNFTVGDTIRLDVSSVRDYLPSDYYEQVQNKKGKIIRLPPCVDGFIVEVKIVGNELPIFINKIFLRLIVPQQLMLFDL